MINNISIEMDKKELVVLINRQLIDILSQSERIVSGAVSIESLENFSRYSEELKTFINNNTSNAMILERVEQIPLIKVKNHSNLSFLFFLVDYLGIGRLYTRIIIKRAITDVKTAQGYYSSIQFLFKNDF